MILFAGPVASAGFLLDVGGVYLADDLTTTSSRTSSRVYYGVGALFNINKKIWGGWNYSSINHTETITTTTDYSSIDTGPSFKWQFGKNELFSAGLVYNILSRATYSNGTTNETWQGTSFLLQFAVMPEFSEGFHIGASLNYFSANYTKKTVSNVESSASNTKTWVFPMLMLTKQW